MIWINGSELAKIWEKPPRTPSRLFRKTQEETSSSIPLTGSKLNDGQAGSMILGHRVSSRSAGAHSVPAPVTIPPGTRGVPQTSTRGTNRNLPVSARKTEGSCHGGGPDARTVVRPATFM